MARLLYCLTLYCLAPLIRLRLFLRSRRQPAYREHQPERWGHYPGKPDNRPLIWIHAVSVGETRATQPIVTALLERYPEHRILLTCMTPTGREAGQALYGERVLQAYLPYDFPGATRHFLDHFGPRLGILMETEIWPNLLASCRARDIPVVLVNARLSTRSARGYRRIAPLVRPALAGLARVAAQTEADAQRLMELGATAPQVCGNLKFDVTPPAGLLEQGREWKDRLAGRPVWLAASTREGEEELILDAYARLTSPAPLLVLVPRHPQRFDEVERLIEARGLSCRRRSIGLPDPDTRVWLGDSMGEMAAYYALADLAFIGGSLLPLGGQNLIEAAACDCPVLIGPHTFNFAQASADALAAGAARRVDDVETLATQVDTLLKNPGQLAAMGAAAQAFAAAHRGAAARSLSLLEPLLASAGR